MIDQMWYKYDITGCLNVFKNRFFCNHLFLLRFLKEDFDIKLDFVNVEKMAPLLSKMWLLLTLISVNGMYIKYLLIQNDVYDWYIKLQFMSNLPMLTRAFIGKRNIF